MKRIVRTIVSSEGSRKIEIYERADGTFGFEHLKWGAPEKAWFPVGSTASRYPNADTAEREARSRVEWASSAETN